MVDVGAKAVTERVALARAEVRLLGATIALIREGQAPKGDVAAVARIAGIMAAKRTSELIPLCHPLPLTSVQVEMALEDPAPGAERGRVILEARAKTSGQTGVEMEALTAVSVAALAVYDMIKAVDRGARHRGHPPARKERRQKRALARGPCLGRRGQQRGGAPAPLPLLHNTSARRALRGPLVHFLAVDVDALHALQQVQRIAAEDGDIRVLAHGASSPRGRPRRRISAGLFVTSFSATSRGKPSRTDRISPTIRCWIGTTQWSVVSATLTPAFTSRPAERRLRSRSSTL